MCYSRWPHWRVLDKDTQHNYLHHVHFHLFSALIDLYFICIYFPISTPPPHTHTIIKFLLHYHFYTHYFFSLMVILHWKCILFHFWLDFPHMFILSLACTQYIFKVTFPHLLKQNKMKTMTINHFLLWSFYPNMTWVEFFISMNVLFVCNDSFSQKRSLWTFDGPEKKEKRKKTLNF